MKPDSVPLGNAGTDAGLWKITIECDYPYEWYLGWWDPLEPNVRRVTICSDDYHELLDLGEKINSVKDRVDTILRELVKEGDENGG